ncbi:hypothetical protein VFPBJ_05697 [Purpureocillium lilacinum]|uniref:Uncharacterized protein n=1 Tax=Purpureocillium lilacinum TaxID=33203 RepID=A0A179GQS8_PURLI|nr:hypothetical protein VFPBJ_05697 [Purpureocillium lilacinum]
MAPSSRPACTSVWMDGMAETPHPQNTARRGMDLEDRTVELCDGYHCFESYHARGSSAMRPTFCATNSFRFLQAGKRMSGRPGHGHGRGNRMHALATRCQWSVPPP